MPLGSWLERRTGRALGSASAVADSKQTLVCSSPSAVLLVGLLLDSLLGWSWATSAAVARKIGFRWEGCRRGAAVRFGEAHDLSFAGALRDDDRSAPASWPEQVR